MKIVLIMFLTVTAGLGALAPRYVPTKKAMSTAIPISTVAFDKSFIHDAKSEMVDPETIAIQKNAEHNGYELHLVHSTQGHHCAAVQLRANVLGPLPQDEKFVASLTDGTKLYANATELQKGYVDCVTPLSHPIDKK